jgi:hypothetical protein
MSRLLKEDKEFKSRSFLLRDAYIDRIDATFDPPSDRVVLQLSHICENKDKDGKDCLKQLSSDHIQLKVRTAFDRGVTTIDQSNLFESKRVDFFCSACGNTIRPKLKSRVGEVPEN